jgi:hypothetical protein
MKKRKETCILYFRWLEHCSLEQQIGFDYLGLELVGKKKKKTETCIVCFRWLEQCLLDVH